MTLKEWKSRFFIGQRLRCTYRWYWEKPQGMNDKPATIEARAKGFEDIQVVEVRATQIIYSSPLGPRVFMSVPKASQLKTTDTGFELYFPTSENYGPAQRGEDQRGKLMSRYLWLPALLLCAASLFAAEQKYFVKSTHIGPGAVAVSCLNGGDPTVAGKVGGSLIVSCGTR